MIHLTRTPTLLQSTKEPITLQDKSTPRKVKITSLTSFSLNAANKAWYGELNEYQLNWLLIEYIHFNILSYIYNVGDLSEYGVCSNWNRKF